MSQNQDFILLVNKNADITLLNIQYAWSFEKRNLELFNLNFNPNFNLFKEEYRICIENLPLFHF
ncbi:hypothetical protein BpHYR1_012336 [Brachionus plicatilis]|uniref:Uncharacterized protein n=1 Tax=Brachionus plicatilis TaxID=10195 RepID=A0A3M7PUS7_BRAPC|nr:hypothetical protein BpHYR1_012336 [Brachionus plicatilis]